MHLQRALLTSHVLQQQASVEAAIEYLRHLHCFVAAHYNDGRSAYLAPSDATSSSLASVAPAWHCKCGTKYAPWHV